MSKDWLTADLTEDHEMVTFIYITYIFYILIYKRHKVVTSEAPFLPRNGLNHLLYSLHLPTKGWTG